MTSSRGNFSLKTFFVLQLLIAPAQIFAQDIDTKDLDPATVQKLMKEAKSRLEEEGKSPDIDPKELDPATVQKLMKGAKSKIEEEGGELLEETQQFEEEPAFSQEEAPAQEKNSLTEDETLEGEVEFLKEEQEKGGSAEVEDEGFDVSSQVEKLNRLIHESFDFEPYIYTGQGRKSPFKAPLVVTVSKKKDQIDSPQSLEPKVGLEGFDVDSFLLTAILWDNHSPKALLKDPSGEVYMVEEGTKIGKSGGYIAKVREGEIVIIEPSYTSGADKKKRFQTQVLKLGR